MAEELDCLACGACCRTGTDGRILIPPEDLTRWRRLGRDDIADAVQPGHFGMLGFATREDPCRVCRSTCGPAVRTDLSR